MNYIKSKPLSRRLLLKGIGATMALPMMEAMGAPTKSSQLATGPDGQPIRYASIFIPNGAFPGTFKPEGSTLDKLPTVLTPLGELSKKCNVISGLSTGFGGHVASTAGFLTGQKPLASQNNSGTFNVINASVDQIIGDAARGTCPLPTLELALHPPRRGKSPSGYPWALANFISWRNASTPVPQELNPMSAFLRLFEHAGLTSKPSKSKKKTFKPNKSVVDAVLDDAKRLQRRLGKNDNQKLDEYLTTVKDVESRILASTKEQAKGVKINEEILASINDTKSKLSSNVKKSELSSIPKIPYPVYIELMMDVMALAMWSNSSRACTLMLGDGGSKRNMSFLEGVSGGHHSISHHGNNPDKMKQYALVNRFFIEQYTYLLKKLDSMKEGGSSVLDNSTIMIGSGIGNGQNHGKSNIPLVMAGSAGGRIKTNRHIIAPNRASVGTLHRSVLDVMNINGDQIQGKGGTLKGI